MIAEKFTCQTKYGKIQVYSDSIGDVFLNGGYYEAGKIALAIEACKGNNGTAIDIGANYGAHALAYTYVFNRVIAFEPQPEIFVLLRNNLPKETEAYQVALGHMIGAAYFTEPFKSHEKRKNYGAAGMTTQNGQLVKLKTLDSYGFKNVDLIKIDVEGAEKLVFFGAQETIKTNRPVIFFENRKGNEAILPSSPETDEFNVFDFLFNECKYHAVKAINKECIDLIALPC